MINILPDIVVAAVKRIPRDLLLQDEEKLKKHVQPSSTLNYLRLNFWLEYNRAQEMQKIMDMRVVLRGVARQGYFYEVVLKNPAMTAWMVTPPADYALVQRDILYSGLEKLQKALKMDLVTTKETVIKMKNGKETKRIVRTPNIAAISEVRKIVEMLSDRVQGAVIQKFAVKQFGGLGVPGGAADPLLPATYEPDALDKLQKLLEKTNATLEQAAGTSDAEVVDGE